MPELRKDLITGDWVIIATERAKRPDKFRGQPQAEASVTDTESCPFCAGNEYMTPKEVFSIGASRDSKPDRQGWQVRVVPNKFPALISGLPLHTKKKGIYDTMEGFGIHEVVILTPRHICDISRLPRTGLVSMLEAYRQRIARLKMDEKIKSIIIMHNQGREAGASLDHIHSQLFALPIIPPEIGKEIKGTIAYFNYHKHCALCDILDFEDKEKIRTVWQDKHFAVLQPFASKSPFETWIVPKKHSPYFDEISDEEIKSLAFCLKLILDFFYEDLDNPAFNYFIHTSPTLIDTSKYFHWHLELLPKLTIKAGFEMGTGVNINITTPESTAEYIKEKIESIKAGV